MPIEINLDNEIGPVETVDLSPERIAKEKDLDEVRAVLEATGERMALFTLDDAERARLRGLLSPEEQALNMECQRFAEQVPELAKEAGCTREEWQEIVARDLALGQADGAVEPLAAQSDVVSKILLADISEMVDAVEDYVAWATSGGVPSPEADRLRAKFDNAAQTHEAVVQRAEARTVRQERRARQGAVRIALAEAELSRIKKIERLEAAARRRSCETD